MRMHSRQVEVLGFKPVTANTVKADDGIRTRDLRTTNAVLYLLSYISTKRDPNYSHQIIIP